MQTVSSNISLINLANVQNIIGDFNALFVILTLTFIMTVETVLTTKVIDDLTKKYTNHNKEIFAHGLGNSLAGIIKLFTSFWSNCKNHSCD